MVTHRTAGLILQQLLKFVDSLLHFVIGLIGSRCGTQLILIPFYEPSRVADNPNHTLPIPLKQFEMVMSFSRLLAYLGDQSVSICHLEVELPPIAIIIMPLIIAHIK